MSLYCADEWRTFENKFEKLEFGKWKLQLPANADGTCAIKHGSVIKVTLGRNCSNSKFFLQNIFLLIKLAMELQTGELVDRISPWAYYVEQCKETSVYHMVFYNPEQVCTARSVLLKSNDHIWISD